MFRNCQWPYWPSAGRAVPPEAPPNSPQGVARGPSWRAPGSGRPAPARARRALIIVAATAAASAVAVPAYAAGAAPAARVAGHASVTAQPDMVTQWNLTMIQGLENAAVAPPPAMRVGAIVQASVFDAVNGISRIYAYYHVAPAASPNTSRAAAAAGAAYTALVALVPAQKPLFDAQLSATLAQLADDPSNPGPPVKRGLTWGTSVANDILAWRASDGFTAVLPPYVPGTDPGDWQPTPPLFGPPVFRQFANMTPFAMTSPSQFLPPPPPSLTSQLWATDLAEVQAYGSATSTVRTPEETQTAQFWDGDTPVAMWDRAADRLLLQQPTSLTNNARLLALMNIAMGDAVIAIWNAKNTYNFWRPVTAIRASSDPTWTPLRPTPPFQEYPSGHAGVSNAGVSVLASFYGDDTSFTVTSFGLPGVERDYTSFSSAVQQVTNARIYAGFHYRFSCVVAAAMGAKIASLVTHNLMHPLH